MPPNSSPPYNFSQFAVGESCSEVLKIAIAGDHKNEAGTHGAIRPQRYRSYLEDIWDLECLLDTTVTEVLGR